MAVCGLPALPASDAAVALVPKFGIYGVAFASPLAWVLADMFLIPAYRHVNNKLKLIIGTDERS